MSGIRAAIENTVSISQFNKGLAGKIFADVRRSGAKVVMKQNTPECVLLSPEEYLHLMDEVNDARLLSIASNRMNQYDPAKTISQEEIDKAFGFSKETCTGAEEIEFE